MRRCKSKISESWAEVFGWDKEFDVPADVFIGHRTYKTNLHSAVVALTGVGARQDDAETYDSTIMWLISLPGDLNASQFESAWESACELNPKELYDSIRERLDPSVV